MDKNTVFPQLCTWLRGQGGGDPTGQEMSEATVSELGVWDALDTT